MRTCRARLLQLSLARGPQASQDTMAALEDKKMNIYTNIRFEGHSDTVRRAVQISNETSSPNAYDHVWGGLPRA